MNCILLFDTDFTDDTKTAVRLDGRRKTHVQTVFRAVEGQIVKVGLVNGLMGTGVVTRIDNDVLELETSLSQSAPAALPLTLIMALCRPKSLKKSIEAVTSLGVKKIFIIESWRVEKSFWSSPALDPEQLLEHVYLGLEQAKDTIVPHIEFRHRFKPFVEDEIPSIIKGTRAFVAHPYDAMPCPYQVSQPITLAIGPEGGFIPYEIELLKKQSFESISFGERILRVEYAIPALIGRLS
jgi:16S rRNA (uracil1498-N3)-methyltransferase